ncbi:MAG: histidinol-phosphatase HisJ family protein [Bacillota bacterium]
MTKLVDYHLHSDSSPDCPIPMATQCERAIELGVEEICFTEHLDLDPRDLAEGCLDDDRYTREIHAARERFGPRLTVRQGVELGEGHRFLSEAQQRLLTRQYDFVLGSIHWTDHLCLGAPFTPDISREQLYGRYFTQLLDLSTKDFYDVIAHFDLAKRYGVAHFGPFDPHDYEEEIRTILRNLIERGKGIEINTSGWRQPPQETLPGPMVLKWYHEMGGEILTMGSDSHRPQHLAYRMGDAYDLARAVGFKAITVFDQRQPRSIDL